MAGRIRAEDIAAVKERISILDVVRDHVSLRSAGIGSMKGLCPFHDEKTPSFTVRETTGSFHCFGCGEGGDVVAFVQKVDHLSFVEAVERLAARAGMELQREEGGDTGVTLGKRSRLVEAHRIAQEFYAEQLVTAQDARAARDFLRQRKFGREEAAHFGVGYSPRTGDALARMLRGRGFSDEELALAGLVGQGSRGSYDRFRGRLMWPIRDTSGDTIGFGARRLYDDDRQQAKYLNTTETSIYKKSTVLYGIDLAKKAISTGRRAVIVEGYTDVMAAHLSGVTSAVATCGTAFGVDHIKLLRRLMRDEPGLDPAKIVFTFDGDAAGQKAAMRAFAEDQRWTAQSFVAVAGDGMDPCDLRIAKGDETVRHLIEDAVPMFEFAIRTLLTHHDLETAEGRVGAMKVVAPVINSVKDPSLRPEYARTVAGWIGVSIEQLNDQLRRSGPLAPPTDHPARRAEPVEADPLPTMPMPDLRDPLVNAESQLLRVLIQYPNVITDGMLESIPADAFVAPAHRAVFEAVAAVEVTEGMTLQQWVEAITHHTPLAAQQMVAALAVAELPIAGAGEGGPGTRYVDSLVARVREVAITREISDNNSRLRRLFTGDGDQDQARAVQLRLTQLQRELAALREGLT